MICMIVGIMHLYKLTHYPSWKPATTMNGSLKIFSIVNCHQRLVAGKLLQGFIH
jgi:hypothetical protein